MLSKAIRPINNSVIQFYVSKYKLKHKFKTNINIMFKINRKEHMDPNQAFYIEFSTL